MDKEREELDRCEQKEDEYWDLHREHCVCCDTYALLDEDDLCSDCT